MQVSLLYMLEQRFYGALENEVTEHNALSLEYIKFMSTFNWIKYFYSN